MKCFFSPKLGEDQKKRSSPTVEVFLFRNHFSPGIWYYTRPEFVGLFRLIIQGSNLDGGHKNLDRGTLNLNEGTLTLDGGARPPYNLSTVYTSTAVFSILLTAT